VLATWAWGGGSLLGTLAGVGVVTGPILSNPQPVHPIPEPRIPLPIWNGGMMGGGSGNSPISQLQSDWKTLITELQTLAAKSGVTVGDIESVALDSQSIAQAGFHFSGSSLHNVISELATAVAGGTSTSQASSDWTSLFSGSSVPTSVVSGTFNDLVKTIQDSNVTTTDLQAVASDEAAIQNDLKNLWMPWMSASVSWMGPLPLVNTSSVAALTVTPPSVAGIAATAVSSIVSSLPVVSEPLIAAPGLPIILPWFGGINLLGSLNHVGVVIGPVVTQQTTAMAMMPASRSSNFQQLITDVRALRTELQSLASKSALTVAELQSLAQDNQSINQAGVHITPSALDTVISELAMAVAGNASTSQALTDWTALFSGSSVSTMVITDTFNDLVKAIGSSKVTTTDLTTVANDETAIQNDLKNLFSGKGSGWGSGSGQGSGSGSSGSSSGATTGKSTHTHHTRSAHVVHKAVKISTSAGVRKEKAASVLAKLKKAGHTKR
jgi:hypothetical protein